MQRELTAQLANQSGLEVISFQHFDCLIFRRGESLKMFCPQSKRVLGGTAAERMVIGDMLLIFARDLERVKPRSKRYRFSEFIASIPTANFPSITACSSIVDGRTDQTFFDQIHNILNELPDAETEWAARFGNGFFASDMISRCVQVVQSLR